MIGDDRELAWPVVIPEAARRAGEHDSLRTGRRKQSHRMSGSEGIEPFVRVQPPVEHPHERSADHGGRDAAIVPLRVPCGVTRDAPVRGRLTRRKGFRELGKTRSENNAQPRRTEPTEKERGTLVEGDHQNSLKTTIWNSCFPTSSRTSDAIARP